MFKYFVPFYYTIHSRSHGLHFVSYILMVFLPSYIILLSNDFCPFDWKFNALYFLSFVGMLSVYELGYIWNDAVCIKKDPNPTKRIGDEEIEYLSKRICMVTVAKICCSAVIVVLLVSLTNLDQAAPYGMSLVVLLIIYTAHNNFRNWVNYITVFFLTVLNYSCTLIFLSKRQFLLQNIMAVVFLFAIPKCFFYVSRKLNYTSAFNEGCKFGIYYLICTIVLMFLHFVFRISILLVMLPAYMCMYRIGISFLRSRRKI